MFDYNAESGEIYIYDEIGPSEFGMIDAGSVAEAIREIGNKKLHVHLNTPGGSVDQGVAIYNLLKAHKAGVVTYVDSLAASMGSYLLQAGNKRYAARNGMVMIHDPSVVARGNAKSFRDIAAILDEYAARMIPDYAERSGKTAEQIVEIMGNEGWYSGQRIVDEGWADDILPANGVAPVVGAIAETFRNAPEELKCAMPEKPEMKAGDLTKFPKRDAIKHKRGMTRTELQDRITRVGALLTQ